MAVDSAGNLLLADTYDNVIQVVAASSGTFYGQAMTAGHIYTVAGNGSGGFTGDHGPALSTDLSYPSGVAAGDGELVISDTENGRITELPIGTGGSSR